MKSMKRFAFALCLGLLAPAPAAADLAVRFVEASPTDLIFVENLEACDLYDFTLVIDLGSSAGGLIFDVSEGGAGASMYQPFEILEGHKGVRQVARVLDGDRVASIRFDYLEAKGRVIFMVDVDDTAPDSAWGQTVIDGTEIAGAAIIVATVGEEPSRSVFLPDGRAVARLRGCGPIS